eukprot:15433535-Alexandrium_andersonii.AAC.1
MRDATAARTPRHATFARGMLNSQLQDTAHARACAARKARHASGTQGGAGSVLGTLRARRVSASSPKSEYSA